MAEWRMVRRHGRGREEVAGVEQVEGGETVGHVGARHAVPFRKNTKSQGKNEMTNKCRDFPFEYSDFGFDPFKITNSRSASPFPSVCSVYSVVFYVLLLFRSFGFGLFEFVSDFGFRASGLNKGDR